MALDTLQNFYKATTLQAWGTGTGTFYVSVAPTPSTGYLVINPSSTAKREIIRYTSKGTDGTGAYVVVSERGVGETSDVSHDSNEPIRLNIVAEHYTAIATELTDKLPASYLDTDGTLAANSDVKVPSQKAVKTYVDTGLATKVGTTGNETVAGIKTFSSSPIVPTPTTDFQASTKKYVDDTAFAGAPDASTTSKGIVEQATEAQVLAGTETGETGAPLFVSPVNVQAAVDFFADKSSIIQNITIPCNQSAADQVRMSGSDDSNSYAYAKASNLLVLMTDGVMPQQRNVQTDYASSEILSVVINGDYVYVLLTASSLCKLFRYSKANLASSPTEITMSGQSFSTTSTNIKMAIDGTTFYFTGKAGNSASLNVISKYTLSGTTLTYDADVTCGATSNDFSAGLAVISGNIYGLNNVDEIITKFNSSGTETDDSDAIFSQPSLTFRDLFNWKGNLFVCQPVRPSTTSGVGASVVFYRIYVS